MPEFRDPIASRISAFLEDIGLTVRRAQLTRPTFLPGIQMRAAGLVVDEERLLYAGDLLHEAVHVVLLTGVQCRFQGAVAGTDLGDVFWGMWCWYAGGVVMGFVAAAVFDPHG